MPPNRSQQLTATDLALALSESHEDSLVNLTDKATAKSLLYRDMTEWPSKGLRTDLATFATNREAYLAFLGYLANGVRVTTAAKALGFRSKQVTSWLNNGRYHLDKGKESCEAWFYMDCYRARGCSLVKAELAAYQNDPEGFIKRMDQGGQFNPNEAVGIEALFRMDDQTLESMNPAEEDTITSSDVASAFEALAEKGILNIEAFAQEAKSQIPQKSNANQGSD